MIRIILHFFPDDLCRTAGRNWMRVAEDRARWREVGDDDDDDFTTKVSLSCHYPYCQQHVRLNKTVKLSIDLNNFTTNYRFERESVQTIDLVLIDQPSVGKRSLLLMDTVNAKKRWMTI
jgi:hypothetical protein